MMAYRLNPGPSIAREVRRIVDEELGRAIEELQGTGDARKDASVHEARRRIKKVNAVTELVASALGDAYGPFHRRIRAANRRLGSIADGESIAEERAVSDTRIMGTRGLRRG